MSESQTVTYINQNFNKVKFSKAETAKGERGFDVEATGSDPVEVMARARRLKSEAESICGRDD